METSLNLSSKNNTNNLLNAPTVRFKKSKSNSNLKKSTLYEQIQEMILLEEKSRRTNKFKTHKYDHNIDNIQRTPIKSHTKQPNKKETQRAFHNLLILNRLRAKKRFEELNKFNSVIEDVNETLQEDCKIGKNSTNPLLKS